MKEFNDKHIKDLQEADGFILQNVHGNKIAIGIDSEYPDIACFILSYIEEYGTLRLADELSYENDREMLNDFINAINFVSDPEDYIKNRFISVFNGISANDYVINLEKKKWHLGDNLEDDKGHKAMIIMNSDRKYVLMNVDSNDKSAFNSGLYYASAYELDFLQDRLREWHKVVED